MINIKMTNIKLKCHLIKPLNRGASFERHILNGVIILINPQNDKYYYFLSF